MGTAPPPRIHIRREVAEALTWGRPVVALESTLIAHGLPRPDNLSIAREVEGIVREEGAVPATVGVISGVAVVGLDDAQLERIASEPGVPKLSVRNLPAALAGGRDGATTVAATAYLAASAGVRVFATGGLGGVHREARESWDESADLLALARVSIGVVCAGVKSILDIGATLERLETLGISIVGYRTQRFPGFYLSDSGHPLDWCVNSPHEVAAMLRAQAEVGLTNSALIIANPIPADRQLDPALHDQALQAGLANLRRDGITGKAVTPYLLDYFRTATGGESLRVNTEIIRNNARLGAQIAQALGA